MRYPGRRKEDFKKGAVALLRNLLGLALIVLLVWGALKLAKIPMPSLQPNKARFLDSP